MANRGLVETATDGRYLSWLATEDDVDVEISRMATKICTVKRANEVTWIEAMSCVDWDRQELWSESSGDFL